MFLVFTALNDAYAGYNTPDTKLQVNKTHRQKHICLTQTKHGTYSFCRMKLPDIHGVGPRTAQVISTLHTITCKRYSSIPGSILQLNWFFKILRISLFIEKPTSTVAF